MLPIEPLQPFNLYLQFPFLSVSEHCHASEATRNPCVPKYPGLKAISSGNHCCYDLMGV